MFFHALSAYLDYGIDQVDGWVIRTSARIIAHLALEQIEAGLVGDVAEIGVYHGKTFIVLANATTSQETAHAVDVFSERKAIKDDSGACADRSIFLSNVQKFAPRAQTNIIQESSLDLEKVGFTDYRLRLLSIDGGHTSAITLNDLRLAERCLIRGGIAALDDILHPEWLGVLSGFAEYLQRAGSLRPFAISPNKLYLTTDLKSADIYRQTLRRNFPLALQKRDVEFFGGSIDWYEEHPYYESGGRPGFHREHDELKVERDNSKPNLQATNSSYRRSGEPLMRRDTVTRGR
jgi:hypothetical protein